MIRFDDVTITYDGAGAPVLRQVDLAIPEGELCVVIGPTGSGKSTLLGAVNGIVPHFTGGHLAGRVTAAGHDTRTTRPRDLAGIVGVVGQDPVATFTTDTVEHELAYTMEQLGLPPATMRKRVEETLDLLGLADLRERPLRTLSGGQQQRVAIGAVLTAHPRILVLDEPTSALDPTAAEEVLAAITRLVHDLGVTALVAEHRLERILQYADRVVEVRGDGMVRDGDPTALMVDAAVAPPVVQLGRRLGWDPLPLSVRDGRRAAAVLRAALDTSTAVEASGSRGSAPIRPGSPDRTDEDRRATSAPPTLTASAITVRYGDLVAVRQVDVSVPAGRITALMGRNGSGKSSLLWALQGSGRRDGGTVSITAAQDDPADLDPADARKLVGLVPQDPGDLLYLATVAAECDQADRESDADQGTCIALLAELIGPVPADTHPRDLSEGQRLALVLAIQLTARPSVVLLDEPTRGLDYDAKHRLTGILRRLADAGAAVAVSTHDVEFAAVASDHVLVMAQGELVADGPTAEVLVASPAFAPQVAKILSPHPLLTVDAAVASAAATAHL